MEVEWNAARAVQGENLKAPDLVTTEIHPAIEDAAGCARASRYSGTRRRAPLILQRAGEVVLVSTSPWCHAIGCCDASCCLCM